MFRKSLAMLLAALLFHMFCVQPASAKSNEEKQAQLAQKVKTEISKLGVGRDALVQLKLRDRTKLAGYIRESNAEAFVVTDTRTGSSTGVAYTDVSEVKGHNLSTGTKIAIGVGIGVALALIALAIWLSNLDGLY